MSKKWQVLADFLAEFAPEPQGYPKKENEYQEPTWKLFVDEASNAMGTGVEVLLMTLDGSIIEQVITLGSPAFNNEAEYEVILAGLQMAQHLGEKHLIIHSDSQFIVK